MGQAWKPGPAGKGKRCRYVITHPAGYGNTAADALPEISGFIFNDGAETPPRDDISAILHTDAVRETIRASPFAVSRNRY